jgi:hypothetical protein
MKNIKKISIATAIVALALFIGLSAFNERKKDLSYWVYTSTDASGFKSADKYEIIEMADPEEYTECPVGDTKPCVFIEVTGGTNTPQTFQSYLDATYHDPSATVNDAAILNQAIRQKD